MPYRPASSTVRRQRVQVAVAVEVARYRAGGEEPFDLRAALAPDLVQDQATAQVAPLDFARGRETGAMCAATGQEAGDGGGWRERRPSAQVEV